MLIQGQPGANRLRKLQLQYSDWQDKSTDNQETAQELEVWVRFNEIQKIRK